MSFAGALSRRFNALIHPQIPLDLCKSLKEGLE